MDGREHEALVHVVDWSVKVLSFCLGSINVIFAIHNLKVTLESVLYFFSIIFISRIRVDRLATLPIIFGLFIEETVITGTIRWCFVNILDVICVLMRSASLVEELLVLSMVVLIVLAIGNIRSVVPSRNPAISWLVDTLLKSMHILKPFKFYLILYNLI